MPQKGGAGTVASLGSGCFCLLRFSVPPGPAHLAAAWLHLSEGLTQYCQGWLAPNWNDTFFFSLQALQLLLHVGVDSMSKQMFSLCFFLLKRKKKIIHGSQQTKLNQPHSFCITGGPWILPCEPDLGASAQEATCPPRNLCQCHTEGHSLGGTISALPPQHITGTGVQPSGVKIHCLGTAFYLHLPFPLATRR